MNLRALPPISAIKPYGFLVVFAGALLLGLSCENGVEMPRAYLAVAILAILWVLGDVLRIGKSPAGPAGWSILAFCAGGLWAVLHSQSISLSLAQSTLLLGLPLGYVVARKLFDSRILKVDHISALMLAFGVVASIQGLSQFAAGRLVKGPFVDINLFSGFLSLPVFLGACGLLLRRNGKLATLALAAALLLAIATKAAIHSRGALLALVAAGALLFFVLARLPSISRKLKISAGLVLFAIVVATGPLAFKRFMHIGEDASFIGRVAMLKSAWQMHADEPSGFGLGTWGLAYPKYRNSREDIESSGEQAHNDYAQGLVEGGWPLVAAYLIPLALVLAKLVEFWRKREIDYAEAAWSAWLVAILLQAGVNFVYQHMGLTLLIGVGLAYLYRTPEKASETGGRAWRSLALLFPAVTLVLSAWLTLGTLAAGIGVNNDDPKIPKELVFRLADLPLADSRMLTAGGWLAAQGTRESDSLKAYAYYDRANKLDPLDSAPYMYKAYLILARKEVLAGKGDAYALLDKALSLNPTDVSTNRLMLTYLLSEAKRPAEAIARLKKANAQAIGANKAMLSLLLASVSSKYPEANLDSTPAPRE